MQRAASALSPELGSHGSAPLRWPSFNPDLTASLLAAVAYYAACLLGFALRFPSSGIGYIWPPNAVLVAALILLAPRVWPIALSFSLVAHGIAHSQDGVSPLAWLCLYAGNAVQALLAATIVRRLCDKPVRLNTLHNVVVFIVGAAFVAPAIASLIPPYFYVKMHWASSFWPAWGMRTLTNVVTTLTLVPPLLWLLRPERRGMNGLTLPRVVEFLILLTALLAVNSAAYMLPHPLSVGLPLALSTSMPFFVWAAARFGVEALSTCLLTVAYVAINPPDEGTTGVATIVGVQMFVGIAVSPFMLLSAALEETRQSHRTKEALHRSETKTAAILRAIPDLMFLQTKDDGHRYVDYYCRRTEDLYAPPEYFIGKPMREVLPPELAHPFEGVFAQAISSGEARVVEYTMSMHGERRYYEARVVPCGPDNVLSIVREITERKRAEIGLHNAQQALERMSRASALGELAASIAHEVQQPLSAISANAAASLRWLDDDAADSQQLTEALSDILEESKRASDVVKRTRDLFRTGQRENVPVEVNSIIAEVVALTRGRIERAGESVRTELADTPLVVMGDRVQLQQVLLNLLLNGLHSMNEAGDVHGTLLVRSWRTDSLVHVAVSDEGEGFDPADLERIFDPFYTTRSDGLGIGLAISRSIVRAHGGTLHALLNDDRGATFEFRIPAAREATDRSDVTPKPLAGDGRDRLSGRERAS